MEHYRAADRVQLAVRRALTAADVVEPLDRAAVLNLLITRLEEERRSAADLAVHTGESYAAVGRALGISRQAARQRHPGQSIAGAEHATGDRA